MLSSNIKEKNYLTLQETYICVSDMIHGLRVAELAIKVCEVLGIKGSLKRDIFISGVFHDIGKSMINPAILNKPDKLSERERKRVKLHAVLGAQIAFDAGFNEECIEIINSHHENYDGTGYPFGRKESEISLGARIIKVCDVYDALRSDRPYRKGYTKNEALLVMDKEKKTFDRKIYAALREVLVSEDKPQND